MEDLIVATMLLLIGESMPEDLEYNNKCFITGDKTECTIDNPKDQKFFILLSSSDETDEERQAIVCDVLDAQTSFDKMGIKCMETKKIGMVRELLQSDFGEKKFEFDVKVEMYEYYFK